VRTLPLFEAPLPTPIATGPRLIREDKCRRCELGGFGHTTCIPAEGVEGKDSAQGLVLVIGDSPTLEEDRQGRPMIGVNGRSVRRVIEKHWAGDYVLDYAVRCHVTRRDTKVVPEAQKQCAPYLRETFTQTMPDRVLVIGGPAARAVLGRSVKPFDTRKNYTWVEHMSGKKVPVFVLMAVAGSVRNRHLLRMLEEDFAWALTVDLATLMPPLDLDPNAVFHIVENEADARVASDALREHDWVAYDCETGGRQFSSFFRNVCVGVAPAEGDTAYVWGRQALADAGALGVLRELMEDPAVGKVGHNEKYDKLSLRAGSETLVQGHVLDTQLARHLELPGCDAQLNTVSELVGMGGYWESFLPHLKRAQELVKKARTKSNKGRQLRLLDEDEVLVAAIEHPKEDVDAYAYALVKSPLLERYNACDCIATARAARSRSGFELVTKFPPARNIWRSVVRHTTNAIEQIEAWGIAVDDGAMEQFNRYIAGEVEKVERRLSLYKINPASPDQVAELLFDKLKLRNPQNPKSRSTDKKALKAMLGQHPVIEDLREHRRLGKLDSAYGSLGAFVRADGRIHPSFKIDGAETGRLSVVDPALHTLPRSKDAEGHEEGGLVKSMFCARLGYRLLELDQSQIELRAACILSGDPVMRQIFTSGEDFHLTSAKLIAPTMWNMAPEDVGDAQRSVTKSFVFGLLYGMTDYGMAARMNCSLDEAARLRAAIMGKFTRLADWITECVREARKTGLVVTPWMGAPGRIRDLHQIVNFDAGDYSPENTKAMAAKRTAENGAVNTPCQTLASDFVLHALCTRIVPWLQQDHSVDAKVVMTVHDSILFEVREDQLRLVSRTARQMMADYETGGLPLVVDEKEGANWGNLDKVPKLQAAA